MELTMKLTPNVRRTANVQTMKPARGAKGRAGAWARESVLESKGAWTFSVEV
jgi:hypothetical protein